MGKIYLIVGKSGSGKDTFYKAALEAYGDLLTPIVPCTTRPMRDGEVDGKNYHFVTEAKLREYMRRGDIIEKREYHTVHGVWTYFTPKFHVDNEKNYICITTLEGVHGFLRAFPVEMVQVIYLDIEAGERLQRCLTRERGMKSPNYIELCRRYTADETDFDAEHLAKIPNLHTIDTTTGTARIWAASALQELIA